MQINLSLLILKLRLNSQLVYPLYVANKYHNRGVDNHPYNSDYYSDLIICKYKIVGKNTSK